MRRHTLRGFAGVIAAAIALPPRAIPLIAPAARATALIAPAARGVRPSRTTRGATCARTRTARTGSACAATSSSAATSSTTALSHRCSIGREYNCRGKS
jgi:hypothetical protein